ncbi:hypothetical protein HME9304_01681 [Flagellimonas maritima]|uniref:DUF2237 domain-containing protein n=1 Tax=Flagellimonas maritima TaxID=1383885 RepID=A0A2Z4LTI4_9FLAO|nr:DUF2237 domain-containing protein [Allomuricauda aurantiaca]AWX44678.1 hypothetical protein HME9304_01681 [Allomuricauda aurantiaca]
MKTQTKSRNKNVLGTELQACCHTPKTGFYRDGFCRTGPEDVGTHVVCAIMTEEFLIYTKAQGNDLSSPMPMYDFPGLQPGNKWCLCASRWKQAQKAGKAPVVVLEATHEKALQIIDFELLLEHKYSNA